MMGARISPASAERRDQAPAVYLFMQEAAKYQVFPLNNDTFARALAPRPSATAGKTIFTYTGVNPGINSSNAPNILGRSYTMIAEARHHGRALGRMGAVPAQRQAGVSLQHADPRPVP